MFILSSEESSSETYTFLNRLKGTFLLSHSPLAKTTRLITPTEFREKNRLPAVYILIASSSVP